MDLDNMPASLVAFARQQTNQQKDFDNKRKVGLSSYMGQVEGKLDACETWVENKTAQLKTTVNALEEMFTTWESKGKEVKPSEITGHRHDK
jgi:flagellar biosynthesis chaperone FliJ